MPDRDYRGWTDTPGAWVRITVEFTSFAQAPAQVDFPAESVDLAIYLHVR